MKSLIPERPYIHDYTRTLVMKLFVSEPAAEEGQTAVNLNFEQILGLIREIDGLSLEIPKIIYLVGWQYCGHDDKYPAFFSVNPALKREGDANAAESLRWLMNEAFRFHTAVSLHINMTDAYQDSPLWETYRDNGLISLNEDGTLMEIGEWGYYRKKTAYQVNYTREWESGCAKERIDRLLALLPIRRAGTIHCDAFFARASKGCSLEQEKEARRRICRYFRDCGVDMTTEFLYGTEEGEASETYAGGKNSGTIGLIPFIWHFNQSREDYMRRPASLLTGAAINRDIPYGKDEGTGFLFGESMQGEDVFKHPNRRYGLNPDWRRAFVRQFCLKTLVWAYLNAHRRIRLEGREEDGEGAVYYEGGLCADLKTKTIRKGETLIRWEDDVFVPVVWKEERQILVYSVRGYRDRDYVLPREWETDGEVSAVAIWGKNRVKKAGCEKKIPVRNGIISLSTGTEEMLLLRG